MRDSIRSINQLRNAYSNSTALNRQNERDNKNKTEVRPIKRYIQCQINGFYFSIITKHIVLECVRICLCAVLLALYGTEMENQGKSEN